MDEYMKKQAEILKEICVRYLETNEPYMVLKGMDIEYIRKKMVQIAECEKAMIDKRKPAARSYANDFEFIYDKNENIMGYSSTDFYRHKCIVRLNKKYEIQPGKRYSTPDIAKIINYTLQTIFHEYRHFEQSIDCTSKSRKDYRTFVIAAENVIRLYNESNWYSKNYDDLMNELDSRQVGQQRVKKIVGLLDGVDKSKKYLQTSYAVRYRDTDEYIDNMSGIAPKTLNGSQFQDREIFMYNQLDMIVSEHPECLDRFPILQHAYNFDGTKKDVYYDYIKNLDGLEGTSAYNLYMELIMHEIEELPVDRLNRSTMSDIYGKLEKYNDLKFGWDMYKLDKLNDYFKKNTGEIGSLNNSDKFIINNLKEVLKAKHKRRKDMLELFQQGRIDEGYYLANYNLVNGADIPYEETVDVSEDLWINVNKARFYLVGAYLRAENDEEFYRRDRGVEDSIRYVLDCSKSRRLSDDYIKFFDVPVEEYTEEHFKKLGVLLVTAKDLTLTAQERNEGMHFFNDFYSIPKVKEICNKMYESEAYKKANQIRFDEEKERKHMTWLDYCWKTAEENQGYCSGKIAKRLKLSKHIDNKHSPEEKAIYRILCAQQGYTVSQLDDTIWRNPTPDLLRDRKTISISSMLRASLEAVKKPDKQSVMKARNAMNIMSRDEGDRTND